MLADVGQIANGSLKRAFDIGVATFVFIIILPVMLVIALLIRVLSPGPILYVENRLGLGGVLFPCYKFRTMHENNGEILKEYLQQDEEARAEWDVYQKLRGYDPRLTSVGGLLRRWSLDELPQLLNIVKGDMSLVGPRPYLPRELDLMGEHVQDIFSVRPGLTGPWQVSGRNNVTLAERLVIEARYGRQWNLTSDIDILLKTFIVVINRSGAF